MAVDMKTAILLFLFCTFLTISAQIRDSAHIHTFISTVVKGKQIMCLMQPNDGTLPPIVMHFDGVKWQNISQDSIPTVKLGESKCVFSQMSDHILVTGRFHIWEFDGKNWSKHAIYDSLYSRREFRDIIALQDGSFIIYALSRFFLPGSQTFLDKNYHEVLQFKNGIFTTLRERWTDKNTNIGSFFSFGSFKVQPNGNYSYYTPMETQLPDRLFELVTFSPTHQIVKKDTNPDLTSYGFNNEFVEYNDYIYDSKGSLWFITSNSQSIQFVGLVEKRPTGELIFYNDNVGLPKRENKNFSLDVDDEDNIWFSHTYRSKPSPFGAISLPSIYKLHSDKTTLTEYLLEDILEKSIVYNGGNSTEQFEVFDWVNDIKYHKAENSILLNLDYVPLLQFFPNKNVSVMEHFVIPIQLYPNPVQSSNILTIESSTFEKVINPLYAVIRDIRGATVSEENANIFGNQVRINTEGLIRGAYFVSVFNNNNLILQTSFVKE